MNAAGRKAIQDILDHLGKLDLAETVEETAQLAEDEQEKFDGMSPGLQATERGQAIEAAAQALASAQASLEELQTALESAIEYLEEAKGGD